MEQRNGCLGGQQCFHECLLDFKWFPDGVPPEIVCVLTSFLFVFGGCFVFLTIAFQYVVLFCVCAFQKLVYKEECENFLLVCFWFWFITLMPDCTNLT